MKFSQAVPKSQGNISWMPTEEALAGERNWTTWTPMALRAGTVRRMRAPAATRTAHEARKSRLLPRVGPRALMTTGLGLATVGVLWWTQLGAHSTYALHVLPAELIVSLGMGMTFVPMSSTALVGVDPHEAGVASALVNATQQVGSSLGTAVLNTVAATASATYLATHLHTVAGAQAAAVRGYTAGFTVSACLLGVAFLISALLIRVDRADPALGEVALEPVGL